MRGLSILTLTAASLIREVACEETIVEVEGITYVSCGEVWYERRFRGGEVVNVVVEGPPGY